MSDESPKSDRPSAWRTLLSNPTLLGGMLAIAAGIIGQYFAAQFQLSTQAHLQKVQGQRQVLARLMGRKSSTVHLYISRYEADIIARYYQARVSPSSSLQDSNDHQEAQRWQHQTMELRLELVKNNQALHEDLGAVWTLFPDTPRLRELIDPIFNFKVIEISGPPRNASAEELMRWRDESVRRLQATVHNNYGAAIGALLVYLATPLAIKD